MLFEGSKEICANEREDYGGTWIAPFESNMMCEGTKLPKDVLNRIT